MKITVWGGSGFLGSHICDVLTDNGHRVTVADIKESSWKKKNQHMFIGSLLDKESVMDSVIGADYVFNFAGIADIGEANETPFRSAEINILGNLNLLEACKTHKIKRYIFASSLYVYSNSGGFYKCSKQACESYIDEYFRQYGLTFTILRFGSLYGLRVGEQNAIYRFVKEAITKKKIVYFGSPNAMREYIHVTDAARICSDILDDNFINQHITVTGNQSRKVGDILHMIKEILCEDIKFEYDTHSQNSHYELTPYNFSPKLGFKYSPKLQIDLGQGLLQIMDIIHQELNDQNR